MASLSAIRTKHTGVDIHLHHYDTRSPDKPVEVVACCLLKFVTGTHQAIATRRLHRKL